MCCPSVLLSFVSICLPVAVAVSHLIKNLITDSDVLGVLRQFCARSLIEKRLHSASRTFPKLATVKYLNREGMQDQA